MKFLNTLAVSILLAGLAWSPAAQAQSDGLYITGGVGVVQPRDSNIEGTGIDLEASFDPGFAGIVSLGSTFGRNVRIEAEFGYRQGDVDDVSGAANSSGDVDGLSLMINGLYDFRNDTNWTPYLGIGVGPMLLDVDGATPVAGSRIDDDDWVIGIQGIAGLGYRVNERLGLFTDYRYLTTTEGEFTTAAGAEVDADYAEHRILFGLRWSFSGTKPAPKPEPQPAPVKKAAAPPPPPAPKAPPKAKPAPPPPPPAPAPAPAPVVNRNFLVFFDWDRSELTDDARAIVRAAAAESSKVAVTVIEVTGHADRSGSDRYNMGLSKRRADTVKAELARLGVAAKDIAVAWKGEREPLVQTADGVREPQNRRVSIIIK